MVEPEPFKFYECIALVRMTGRRAGDIIEFLEILKQVGPGSIFHHMHQYFLKPHVLPPQYPNEFAVWVADELEDKVLAERLANLNPFEFARIEDVRGELIRIVTSHLKEYPAPRPVIKGKEFFFNTAITLVIPTGLEASTIEEFVRALKVVDNSSIYFHFYEAKLRLDKEEDDFSRFFSDREEELCQKIAGRIRLLDPYMYSTEVLRSKLLSIIDTETAA